MALLVSGGARFAPDYAAEIPFCQGAQKLSFVRRSSSALGQAIYCDLDRRSGRDFGQPGVFGQREGKSATPTQCPARWIPGNGPTPLRPEES